MTARPLISALLLASAALACTGLAGCGKTGLLEQPAPRFGTQAKADYAAAKQADADAKARQAAAKKAQSGAPIVDDPVNQPAPQGPYNPPNPAHLSDPFGPAPQGAMPNPGTSPNP
jgi:hypothetical protein